MIASSYSFKIILSTDSHVFQALDTSGHESFVGKKAGAMWCESPTAQAISEARRADDGDADSEDDEHAGLNTLLDEIFDEWLRVRKL